MSDQLLSDAGASGKSAPEAPTAPILTAAERHRLLVEWNNTRADFPRDKCIHELFEAQAARTPDAVAVEEVRYLAGPSRREPEVTRLQLTYRELNARADQLAHHLRQLGVGPETLVAICVERTLEMVVGVLGILKAGGAYVPLDPNYPKERLAFMLADSRAPVLVTQERLLTGLPAHEANVVVLETFQNSPVQNAKPAPQSPAPENLAYVIYTSGSTGQPKGVQIPHRALVNHSTALSKRYGLKPGERTLQSASISFDVAAEEIFPPLLSGATVVLRPDEAMASLADFLKFVEQQKLTVLELPTAYWQELVSELARTHATMPPSLRLMVVGTEKVLSQTYAQWRALAGDKIEWLDAYGPTETTVTATIFTPPSPYAIGDTVPIGRPIANVEAYILDEQMNPVPVGTPGELHLGGAGLARGYLRRPELTAAKFVAHPFRTEPGARLYKTGDRVRYLPDGNIEFLGRIDEQVKIRGYRIEPGEIEAALLKHPAVKNAAVVAREDKPGQSRLVAYVIGEEFKASRNLSELRLHLQANLPDYMVPSAFVVLEALPVLPNGKINRRALPAPELNRSALAEEFVAPRSPTEETLAGIWSEVLGVKRVGVLDNFFALGGDSIQATQAVSRVREKFATNLSVRHLFEKPTIARLAEFVAANGSTALRELPLARVPRAGELPLSFAQQRLWFIDQMEPGGASYNMPEALRWTGALNVRALEESLNEIVRRHEVLRTTFAAVDGRPIQVIQPFQRLDLPVVDLRHLPAAEREVPAQTFAQQGARRPFDLAKDWMLRSTLLRLGEEDYLLLLTIHHIAADAWSLGVIYDELVELYKLFAAGTSPALPEPPIQYSDFAVWQRQWLQGEVMERELAYWKKQLSGSPPVLDLPADRPRPALQTERGATQSFVLSPALGETLTALGRREGATLYMTLLAAFQMLLQRCTEQEEIVVGSPIAGRNRRETERLIGFFVNTLVLRTNCAGNPTFLELLRRVREVTLGAFAHQEVPFEKLVEELKPERAPSHSPLFQVMFALQNAPLPVLELSSLKLRAEELDSGTALFDLTLQITAGTAEGMHALLTYNTDLFDAATITRLCEQFRQLIERVAANPELRLADWPRLRPSIDLTAVAAALREDGSVIDCAVLERETKDGLRQLVAYVIPTGAFTPEKWRARLRSMLPAYQLPRVFVPLARLPLTPAGAVDEAALSQLEVIDEPLLKAWETQLQSVPGVERVAVIVRDKVATEWPLHIADLLPDFKTAKKVSTAPVLQPDDQTVDSKQVRPLAIVEGAALKFEADAPIVLADILRRAATQPDKGVIYLEAAGIEVKQSYRELLQDAQRVLAGLRAAGLKPQDKVIFQLENNRDFLTAFWGCVLGGFIPVPLAVAANYEADSSTVKKLQQSLGVLGNALILTGEKLAPKIRSLAQLPGLEQLRIATMEAWKESAPDTQWHPGQPDDLALLILTSGSTGAAKLVMLSHRNLLGRCAGWIQMNGSTSDEVTLNWLPLDHVGGLIHFHLRDVFLGCRQIHAATHLALEEPLRWLDWLEHHRVTNTWAPNFAFALINDRAEQIRQRKWDLSCLRFIMNGAEAIVARTARQFLKLLEPHGLPSTAMQPAWGMAETSSGSVGSKNFSCGSTSDEDSFVEVGSPVPGLSLRIVDEENRIVTEETIGRLQVKGHPVTTGYFQNDALNREVFTADGWFDTGDLGFLRGGRLTITGRRKDVIIINAVNYYSHEIEAVVETVEGVRVSFTAACAVREPNSETDSLAVFFCPESPDEKYLVALLQEIRSRVNREIGVNPSCVIPVELADIPKTSVGKIQRSLLRQRFEAGEFESALKRLDILGRTANTVPNWFYRPRWQRKELKKAKAKPTPTLIFSDRGGLGAELCEQFGTGCVRVEAGDDFARLGENHFRLHPAEPEHYRRLLAALADDEFQPGQIVHLWTYGKSSGAVTSERSLGEAQSSGLCSVLFLAQALAQVNEAARPVRLLVVSSGTQAVSESDAVVFARAPLLGLLKVIPQEMPWLQCRHVDLSVDEGIKANAPQILAELQDAFVDSEVAYRNGERLAPLLEKVAFTGEAKQSVRFKPGGFYLITGGLGGIGALIAKYLLEHFGAKLLLIGRTPLPERSTWTEYLSRPQEETARRIHAWQSLEQAGGEVVYEALDICDLGKLRGAVERAEHRWSCKLEGALHLAGMAQERLLQDETRESLLAILRPKMGGAWALHEILKERPGAFSLSFSSVNSFFGGHGYGAYAAANRFLETFAHYQRQQAGPLHFCFAWSSWDEVGMNLNFARQEFSRQRGFEAIPPEQGMVSLLAGLRRGETHLFIGLDGANSFIQRHTVEDLAGAQKLVACFTAIRETFSAAPFATVKVQDRFGAWTDCEFVQLAEMPLREDGEIDRDRLLSGRSGGPSVDENVAPRTEVEQRLAAIWKELLGVSSVGVLDNFFEMGGHSLLATQMISRVRQAFRVELPLQKLFEVPTIGGLAQSIQDSVGQVSHMRITPIKPIARQGEFPLSFAQERLWFVDQLMPGSAFHNILTAIRLHGTLDVAALEESFNEVIQRHETLRTTFKVVDEVAMQVVAMGLKLTLSVQDLQSCPAGEREVEMRRLAVEEGQRPFDLSKGPLIRARLVRLSAEEQVLLWTMHHIISDGWSQGVIIRELAVIYESILSGKALALPELSVQYVDYAQWQRQWLHGEVMEKQLTYWKKQLGNNLPVLDLPLDQPRPAVQTFRGATRTFAIPQRVTEELKALGHREGATLFMTLLAAFKILLCRYTRQEDVVVGTPIANRNRVETEALIGFLTNTLVLRSDLSGNPTFRELLRRVRSVALGAFEHQDLPFEKLVEVLNPERDLSHQPLFQVMFVLQNAPMEDLKLTGLKLAPIEVDIEMSMFDITLYLHETAAGLTGVFEYNTDLFAAERIARMAGHYQTLLEGLASNPEQRVWEAPVLTLPERQQLLVDWPGQAVTIPKAKCIHQIFEEQVEKTPEAVAVKIGEQSLTYRELNQRANALARQLRQAGVGPETLVGLCAERSPELIVGMVAILKAGGAYLPLDLAYPQERIAFMLADAAVPVLLTQEQLVPLLPPHKARVIFLEAPTEAAGQSQSSARENLENISTPDSLAYVIYTSGSTGQPKGVPVTHYNVARLFQATEEWFHFNASDVWTLFHSYAFDFSVWELWGALLYGGRLVVVPFWESRSPAEFYELLAREKVTVLNQTPSAFRQLIWAEESAAVKKELSLRLVIFGGEALEMQSLKPWFERHGDVKPQLVNMYGITETTVHVTYRPLRIADLAGGSVIGKAIPDLEIYLLDAHLQPVPMGVSGEIFVGGAGVARGYLQRPELTSERFIANPFRPESKSRLYRSGDLARFSKNGELEYLGRADQQVKIRGFRIELGEVEAALGQHPQVRECVVVAHETTPGDKRLVAYFVSRTESVPGTSELVEFLKQKLPDHMIPALLISLKALPLTPNGKVDHQALPPPEMHRPELAEVIIGPRNALELRLKRIWESVLGIKSIGIRDNFFELGGHSLMAVRLFAQIEKALGKHLPLATLFQARTVEQMASILSQEDWIPPWSSLVAIQPQGSKPPFFIIHGIGGNVLNFHGLAQHLGEDQPVYGLQSQGLDGTKITPTRIEDMAAHYINEIRTLQPEGPYYLGGMSFGGVVAYEMAQQFHAQNQPVGLLALLDSFPLGYSELMPITERSRREIDFLARRIKLHWQNFFALPGSGKLDYIRRKSRTLQRRVKTRLWQIAYKFYARKGRELPEVLQNVKQANYLAAKDYVTKTYAGRITLFLAREQSLADMYDPKVVWGKLVLGGVETHEIPGDHVTLIEEPHVRKLAEKLRGCLSPSVSNRKPE